jgi:Regulator of ribonuclease activity B
MNQRALKNTVTRQAARNAAVMRNITARGGDVNRGRVIDCFFFAPTEDDAISLCRSLQSMGIRELSISLSDANSEASWSVHGEIISSVSAFTAPEQMEKILRFAAKHRSIFDGWGTLLDE